MWVWLLLKADEKPSMSKSFLWVFGVVVNRRDCCMHKYISSGRCVSKQIFSGKFQMYHTGRNSSVHVYLNKCTCTGWQDKATLSYW